MLGEPQVAVGPATIAVGLLSVVSPLENSVIAPDGVIRPMRPGRDFWVNHRLLSGPATIPLGLASEASPLENSGTVPADVMRPIASASPSVNHTFPSGPFVSAEGPLVAFGITKSETAGAA